MKTSAFKSPCRRSRIGFTLPEVVITAVLALMVVTPLIRLSYLVTRNTRYSRDVGEALAVGRRQIEVLAQAGAEAVRSGSRTEGEFLLTWTVIPVGENRVVQMDITWTILGMDLTVPLNTVFGPAVNSTYTLP